MFTHILILLALTSDVPQRALFHDEAACENAVRQIEAKWPGKLSGICLPLETTYPPEPSRKPKARP